MSPSTEIRALCLDVDGVLTDGRLYTDEQGHVMRAFHIHDGLAIRWFGRLGGTVFICTGKRSRAIEDRAHELGIEHVIQGSQDKHADVDKLMTELGLEWSGLAAVGDDLPDVPVLRRCGYPIAVANAVEPVRRAARYVTRAAGGRGAVREAIEHLLEQGGRWREVERHYGIGT